MKFQIITNDKEQLISARELYYFLEVKRDFSTWIKGRIKKFSFLENEDFQQIYLAPQNGGVSHGGHNKIDYIITLDMAKELCMIENNVKGREARKYFIKCEKEYIQSLKNKSLSLGSEELFNSIEWNKLQSYNRAISNIQNAISEEIESINKSLRRIQGFSNEINLYCSTSQNYFKRIEKGEVLDMKLLK